MSTHTSADLFGGNIAASPYLGNNTPFEKGRAVLECHALSSESPASDRWSRRQAS